MVVVDDYCANVRLNAENPTQMSDAYRTPLTFDYLLAAVVTLEMPYHSGVIVTRSAIASRGSHPHSLERLAAKLSDFSSSAPHLLDMLG